MNADARIGRSTYINHKQTIIKNKNDEHLCFTSELGYEKRQPAEPFSQYGEVSSANVITDRETGRSRGFGFVEMPNETEGQAAIDALDGTDFEGKTIGVNVAKPKADRPAGGYGGGNRGGGYGGGYGNRRY